MHVDPNAQRLAGTIRLTAQRIECSGETEADRECRQVCVLRKPTLSSSAAADSMVGWFGTYGDGKGGGIDILLQQRGLDVSDQHNTKNTGKHLQKIS